MQHLIINIKDESKVSFLLEILKRMEFVEVVAPKEFTAKEKKFLRI